MTWILLFLIFVITAETAMINRFPVLLRSFRYQSLCLALLTLLTAYREASLELYIIAFLLFVIKVMLIPWSFNILVKRIKTNEHLGLFISQPIALTFMVILALVSWYFANTIVFSPHYLDQLTIMIACFILLTGVFLMISKVKALGQVIGLLMTENGIFLAATIIPGGMPFFVEIALFFDILISVMILGLFVYRINAIFTHIDVSELTGLKG